uniref:ApaG domain-containing protein n=1 Tax=Mucochytrium quahogii TaxID=96639 RepID=A0A7S2SEC7_9STRA|mmetsp:Transcript_8218/g.13280  ORF Transcript_8218/g.13280 Transcript_8218/m.13280 type:complete len:336 (+) Transcript_8218:391-1398(+)
MATKLARRLYKSALQELKSHRINNNGYQVPVVRLVPEHLDEGHGFNLHDEWKGGFQMIVNSWFKETQDHHRPADDRYRQIIHQHVRETWLPWLKENRQRHSAAFGQSEMWRDKKDSVLFSGILAHDPNRKPDISTDNYVTDYELRELVAGLSRQAPVSPSEYLEFHSVGMNLLRKIILSGQTSSTAMTRVIGHEGDTLLKIQISTEGQDLSGDGNHYAFWYNVCFLTCPGPAKTGTHHIRILGRHLKFKDAEGNVVTSVDRFGDGVVGKQPILGSPGFNSFQYMSSCRLPTSTGKMEGSFLVATRPIYCEDRELAYFDKEERVEVPFSTVSLCAF